MNFGLESSRKRRFTHAVALDSHGNEVGHGLCSVVWAPGIGIKPYKSFEITMLQEATVARIIIEQDPPSDLALAVDVDRWIGSSDRLIMRQTR